MFKYLVCSLLLLSSLLLPPLESYKPTVEPYQSLYDPRIHQLVAFCVSHNFLTCPKEYVKAADKNKIDFRWLPCIDLLESSGGWHYPKDTNNRWGYGSSTGLLKFQSLTDGIDFISDKLANGRPYAGKTIEGKIKTYNSVNPEYYPKFKSCVNSIT